MKKRLIFSLTFLLVISIQLTAIAVEVSSSLESKVEQKGEDADLNFHNDLKIKLKDDMTLNERLKYDMEIKVYMGLTGIDPDTFKNEDNRAQNLSLDEIKFEYFDVTYQGNIFNYTFQENRDDYTSSYDYLGLIDATTNKDDRDYTLNPNDDDGIAEDNLRVKVATVKNGYDFNFAMTKYDDNKHLGYINLRKDFNFFGKKGYVGTTTMVTDINGKLLDNVVVFGQYKVLNNLIVRGEYGHLGYGASGEMEIAVVTEVNEDKVKFIFDPQLYKITEEITEVHVVGGDFVTGWNPTDKTIALNDSDGDGVWTGEFNVGQYGIEEDKEFKFVFNNGGWDKGYGDPTLANPTKGNAVVGKDYTNVDKSGNAYLAEVNYRLSKANKTESVALTAKDGSKFRFTFDPANWDIEEEISEVHVVSGVNDWMINDKTYPLTQQANGSWIGTFDIPEGTGFKFIYNNAQDWGADTDQVVGVEIGSDAAELKVQSNEYKPENYKFDYTVGTKVIEEGLDNSLPVANDDLADKNERINGYVKYYGQGHYYPINSDDLKVTLDLLYQTDYDNEDTKDVDESKEVRHQKIEPALTWEKPIAGIKEVKGSFMHDKVYDWDLDDRDPSLRERNEYFVEVKTDKLSSIDYIKSSTRYHPELEMTELFTEVAVDVPVKQITEVKVNLDYKVNDSKVDKPRFYVQGKLERLPFIGGVLSNIYVNFESDVSGIKDLAEYGDDDNDWKYKAYADTELIVPFIDLKMKPKVEVQKIEDEVINDISVHDLDENSNHKYVVDGDHINLYTIVTLETGYDLPFGIRGDLTVKYDVNHGEISEYEDDALKVKLTKDLSEGTSVEFYYNKQDDDEDDQTFIKLLLKTEF